MREYGLPRIYLYKKSIMCINQFVSGFVEQVQAAQETRNSKVINEIFPRVCKSSLL
ncbi:hypothetical protein ACE6H2_020566 [Prunus campanulata]